MNSQLVEQVTAFVASQTGVKVSRLTPETKLRGDLGIDGADGWELIEEFGRQFDVDISTFQAKKHFGPEGFGCFILSLLLPSVFGEISDILPDITQITVRDLAEAAEAKRWLK
jgi:acyl carrier protein